MTTIRQAIFTTLRAATAVTGLLSGGLNGVLLSGRVKPSTPMPCLGLEMGTVSGRVTDLPFTSASFYIYAYVSDKASSTATYIGIDKILDAVRVTLHGASLSISGVSYGLFGTNCHWDNYRSADHFDERRRAYYRYDRYRVAKALTFHYH